MQRDILKIITKIMVMTIILAGMWGCGQTVTPDWEWKTDTSYDHPTFAPDGRIVASKVVRTYRRMRVGRDEEVSYAYYLTSMSQDGSNETNLFTLETFAKFQIEVSPLMNYVIVDDTLFDMKTGKKLRDSLNTGIRFDWSPDEKYIAVIDLDYKLNIYNPFTGQLVKNLGIKCGQQLTWKYQSKIAFILDDINQPDVWLSFILPDGSGLVTTNIPAWVMVCDRTKNYLYDFKDDGLHATDLTTLTRSLVTPYTRPASVSSNIFVKNISPLGDIFLLSTIEGHGISVERIDGSGHKALR